MCEDASEHWKILLKCEALFVLRDRRRTIGERYYAEALLVARACGRLDTAICKEPCYG